MIRYIRRISAIGLATAALLALSAPGALAKGDVDGALAFVPEDFFLGTPSNIDQTPYTGEPLENGVRWYITKPGYTFVGPPPANSLGILICE